jgi:hypothetical protein
MIIFIVVILFIIFYITYQTKETFGGLVSLYSNYGPQDAYLTKDNYGPTYLWNMPTRVMSRSVLYYPAIYSNMFDLYNNYFYN